jgi:hypothetical protein
MLKVSKKIFAIIFIAGSFAFVIQNWVTVKSHGFITEFPRQPEVDSQILPSAAGNLTLHTFMYEPSTADDNLVYGVILTKYPDSLINSGKEPLIKGIFRGAIDGAVKNTEGKLLSEKEIELEGHPGREVRIDYKSGVAIIKMRMYLVKSTMYVQQVIMELKKENNKTEQRFLNAFKLDK